MKINDIFRKKAVLDVLHMLIDKGQVDDNGKKTLETESQGLRESCQDHNIINMIVSSLRVEQHILK